MYALMHLKKALFTDYVGIPTGGNTFNHHNKHKKKYIQMIE